MEVDGAMKVDNTSVFLGDNTRRERNSIAAEEKSSGRNIFAGNLNKQFDPIAEKKQEARKQAMKIVGDAWAGERKIDDDLANRSAKIEKYRETLRKAGDELKEIENRRAQLRDSYRVEEDSEEEENLKLLEKELAAKKIDSGIHLTKEEEKQLAEIKEAGLTEYQKRSLELKENGAPYEQEIAEARKQIQIENAVIRGTKLERLKSQTMIKAQESAKDVLEAASEQIVGMLIDEAKDHVDEKMAEEKKAAEEKAEKKEAEEERIQKQKDKKKEKEELMEDVAKTTEFVVEADQVLDEVQKEIKKIVDEMKLLEEDIKGAAVDTTVG